MRLLDHDPLTGVSVWHEFDALTGRTTIKTEQDVETYLERNKRIFNEDDISAHGKKEGWWHVASIPIIVQDKWMREYGVNIWNKDHIKKVKQLLNSPEWRYLRTAPGRL